MNIGRPQKRSTGHWEGHEMTETALETSETTKSDNLSDSTGNTQEAPVTQASGHANNETKETK